MAAGDRDPDGEEVGSNTVGDGKLPRAALDAVDAGLATFDLTVLPMEASEDGFWVYPEAAIDLVKDLRSVGVDAGYAHVPDDRRYYSERSAEIAVSFLVSLGSAAVWQAFMYALQRFRGRQQLSVTLVDERLADGSERRSATFAGRGEDVLEAMRAYRGDSGSSTPDD